MSHWNYRIVEVQTAEGPELGIYEVYYDDDGYPNGRTKDPAVFVGGTRLEVLDALSQAFNGGARPVLRDSDISGSAT